MGFHNHRKHMLRDIFNQNKSDYKCIEKKTCIQMKFIQ